MKKAKLVTVVVTTRVVADADSTDEQIMEKAIPHLLRNLSEDGCLDHLDDIVDDKECPFGTLEGEFDPSEGVEDGGMPNNEMGAGR